MFKNLSKIFPLIISVLLFTSVYVFYITISSKNNIRLQLSPEKVSYTDRFKENISYNGKDVSETEFIKNIRVNENAGVSEPKIICSPVNENILALAANNFSGKDNFATVFISFDRGLNWSEKEIPLCSKFKSSSYSDPYIDFDIDGNIVFTAIERDLLNSDREGICFARSTDIGNSWKANPGFIDFNGKENIKLGKPKLVTGKTSSEKEYVYVTWTEYKGLNSYIMITGSTDGGLTYSQPKEIENTKVKFSSVLRNNKRELFVIYLKNEKEIRLKKSSDNGENWISVNSFIPIIPSGKYTDGQYLIKEHSGNGIRINSEPNAVISGNSDLLLTYCSRSDNNDLSDIYFCKFETGTSEFSNPVKVNSDNTNCDQFLPAITNDPSGNIFIVYQDSRNDLANILTESYLSYSSDGGLTFNDKKISLKSFDPGNISVRNYIGDHNTCILSGNELIAVWTDGRNNNFDLYAGVFDFGEFTKH